MHQLRYGMLAITYTLLQLRCNESNCLGAVKPDTSCQALLCQGSYLFHGLV